MTSVESTASSANTRSQTNATAISNIGYYVRATASDVSIATSTDKKICTIDLDPGTWVLVGTIGYSSNSTGTRWNYLGTASSTGTNAQTNVSVRATSTSLTFVQNTQLYKISSATTYNLVGWQNSGSTLTCSAHIVAFRIK